MRRRFLIAWSPGHLTEGRRARLHGLCRSVADLSLRIDDPHLVILGDPLLPALDIGSRGHLLGTIYDRGSTRPLTELPSNDTAAVVSTAGKVLITRYWGNYVALLVEPPMSRLQLIRAPFGDLGCYCRKDGDLWLVASDAALLAGASAARPALDWQALARHLAEPELVTSETALAGMSEVRGGSRVTLGSDDAPEETVLWSPWHFATQARPESTPDEAVHQLHDAVRRAVLASAAPYPHVVILQSGGLDSSIVAACLADGGHQFSGLNLVTEDPTGDERIYARAVAASLGSNLRERNRDPSGVDFTCSLAAVLPRPMARAFSQETERLSQLEATELGASAIFDGSGGDNVFCSHRSVAAVADSLLADGFRREAINVARSLGDITGTSLPQVMLRAVRRAWLRPAKIRRELDLRLIGTGFREAAGDRSEHPWFVPPAGIRPGQALHVSLLAFAQALVEAAGVASPLDRVSPLMSQPVAEACLSIPNALWFAPGQDRAAARRAFAASLPPVIINRLSKGSPATFVAELLARRRHELRPFLLDGVLASAGLLDTSAARSFLDDPGPSRGFLYTRILTLLDTEAWARHWA